VKKETPAMEKNGLAKHLGFFAAGAFAGGIAAMLATPYSGPKIRRMLRYKVAEGKERISDSAGDLRKQCSRLYGRGAKALAGASLLSAGARLLQRTSRG
jgi:hypothetical protein